MESESDKSRHEGRPTQNVGRPLIVNDLDSDEIVDKKIDYGVKSLDKFLEQKKKIGLHKRRENSENIRQIIVLGVFSLIAIYIIFGLTISTWNLLTMGEGVQLERSKWVIETLLGGLIAGLIGFIGVKTFEK